MTPGQRALVRERLARQQFVGSAVLAGMGKRDAERAWDFDLGEIDRAAWKAKADEILELVPVTELRPVTAAAGGTVIAAAAWMHGSCSRVTWTRDETQPEHCEHEGCSMRTDRWTRLYTEDRRERELGWCPDNLLADHPQIGLCSYCGRPCGYLFPAGGVPGGGEWRHLDPRDDVPGHVGCPIPQ